MPVVDATENDQVLVDDAGNMIPPGFGLLFLIYDEMAPGLVLDVEYADFWDAVAQWLNIKLAFASRFLLAFVVRHKSVDLPSIENDFISLGRRIFPDAASMVHPISNYFHFVRFIGIYFILQSLDWMALRVIYLNLI